MSMIGTTAAKLEREAKLRRRREAKATRRQKRRDLRAAEQHFRHTVETDPTISVATGIRE